MQIKTIHHDLGIDTEAVSIVPLSDLHLGAEFNPEPFYKYREWILAEPNRYCVLNGDILDMAIKSSIGDVYTSMRPKEQIDLAVRMLQPLAAENRILAYLDGNHEYRVTKEVDIHPGEHICALLGIPRLYDANGCVLFLSVGHNRKKAGTSGNHKKVNRMTYTIFMLHGSRGGRRIGGKANALEDMQSVCVCDCYIVAHTHQKMVFSKKIIIPEGRNKTLKYKEQTFVNCGSFLDYAEYAIRKGYPPGVTGTPIIELDGTRHEVRARV